MENIDTFNLINIDEAARMLGVSIMTLRRWDKTGKFPAVRLSPKGIRKYKVEDLKLLIRSQLN